MPSTAAEVLNQEIEKYDWLSIKSFMGDAAALPAAITALVFADSEHAANAAYWRIDNVAIVQGRLSESVAPLTSCLLVGLAFANETARGYVLDLLATIAGGYDEHVDSDAVGNISVKQCVRSMARHFPVFVVELTERGNASSVDIILMCAVYDDDGLRADAIRVFEEALHLPSCAGITGLLETSLAELR